MNAAPVLLPAREISKGFPGVQALDAMSLHLRGGELTAAQQQMVEIVQVVLYQ